MSGPMSPNGSVRRGPLIVMIVVLALAAVGIPVIVYLARSGGSDSVAPEPTQPSASGTRQPGTPSTAQPSDPTADPSAEKIQPGQPVTAERLSKVDPADFYFGVLDRQLTRPVSQISNAYFRKPADFQSHLAYYAHKVTIDHRTRKFTTALTSRHRGKVDSQSQCVNGHAFYLSSYDKKWTRMASSDGDCKTLRFGDLGSATDGVVASGLSGDQAAKVIAKLRDGYKGFTNPRQPTLVTAGGRQYVKQVVDFKPVKAVDGHYWGTQVFTWAFQASGLDAKSWPWYSGLGPGEGIHMVYFLDTKTLLPVASIQRTTPVLDDNGKPKTAYNQTMVFGYAFPNAIPTKLDNAPVTLNPPQGWRID